MMSVFVIGRKNIFGVGLKNTAPTLESVITHSEVRMLFHKSLVLALVVFFQISSSDSIAASGERFTEKGYAFDISADQMGEDLLVRGHVSGGETCKKLIITFYFQNETGSSTHVKVMVNNYGGYEPFSIRKKTPVKKTSRWSISNVHIKRYD
jgi:hypothetical protein